MGSHSHFVCESSSFRSYCALFSECAVPVFHRFHMPESGLAMFWFAGTLRNMFRLSIKSHSCFRYSYNYGSVHFTVLSSEHNFTVGLFACLIMTNPTSR